MLKNNKYIKELITRYHKVTGSYKYLYIIVKLNLSDK